MLLLLLILNISRIPIWHFLELLRPFVNICLWFVLCTLVINLWLEHSSLLVGNSILKSFLFCVFNRVLSVVIEVCEFLMNCKYLVIINGKRLTVDQTLNSC